MSSEKQGRIAKPDDDDFDLVEEMIKRTGCLRQHYAVQECYGDKKDWRKCNSELSEFRKCMDAHNKGQEKR